MANKGLVFSIQPFSIHDGKGIRTNVFLKGCPLHCLWCHNPEGLSSTLDVEYFENKCQHCGTCGFIFEHMHDVLKMREEEKIHLTKQCPYHALDLVGRWMTVDEVIDEVMIDYRFYQSSQGGMTISGGEPMLQKDFTYALMKKAKEKGLMTAMETSGYAPLDAYVKVAPYVDQFLWDDKESDSAKHKKFTGVGNDKISNNFEHLYQHGAHIKLRCPVIPGLNDTEEHFRGIAHRVVMHPDLDGWEIMPYHNFGLAKEKRLGNDRGYRFQVPDKGQKEKWNQIIQTYIEKEEQNESIYQ